MSKEYVVKQKVDYLVNELGVKKTFIAKKIGIGRTTLSHLTNDNNKRYNAASAETVAKVINKLNETWPMLQGIGE